MTLRGFIRNNSMRAKPHGEFDHNKPKPDRWNDVDCAPLGKPVVVLVEAAGGEYRLPYRCVKHSDGWRREGCEKLLAVPVTGWRWNDGGVA